MRSIALPVALAILSIPVPAWAAVLAYDESVSGDFTWNFLTPAQLGPVDVGVNTVAGGIDFSGFPPMGDDADIFAFVVPAGLAVTQVKITVTNAVIPDPFSLLARMTPSVNGPQIKAEFISGNQVINNLIATPQGVLNAGTYDLQIYAAVDPDDMFAESFDYLVELVVAPVFLDIDGNGVLTPLTDGLLYLRWMFGFTGETLISQALGVGCTRCTAQAIVEYLEALNANAVGP
jgi:hypothetical protein